VRWPPVGRAARAVAAARGRSVALVYHRVDEVDRPRGLVPGVAVEVFRRHLEVLGELGDLVGVDALLASAVGTRPRFALTFDDDFATHVSCALPALLASSAPATFFLSGRAFHAAGAYWFERLDALITELGAAEAGRRIGVGATDAETLALACENDERLWRRVEGEAGEVAVEHIGADGVRTLAAAGMTIGFHTLEHRVLPNLDDHALRLAMTLGRPELEAAAAAPARHFAYPHGRADARAAAAVASAGFVSAWTGVPRAVTRRSDRFRLGRWEPGPLSVDDLVASLAVRLNMDA
jgi:peptidoglycan/xylan/chitin deacetylase (PgdA/CDA1 family)